MIGISWTGTDGSVWDLVTGAVRLTPGGLTGLGMPLPSDQVQETALSDGQRFTGWRLPARPVWLPLKWSYEAQGDVEGVQRAFWRSVAIGDTGTLTVTDGSGATRQLGLRFQSDGGYAMRLDPYVRADAFGLTFVADRPWWEGPTQGGAYSLGAASPETFFGDGAGGTPFFIVPAQGAQESEFTNPGDTPAWLTWTLTGPFTVFRAGVAGHYLGGPIAVGAASVLVIETDPLRQLAFLDGVKITRQLTEIDWAPLPRGVNTGVDVSVVGTGLISYTFRPRYARAL